LVSQRQVDEALRWIDQGGFLIVGVGQETEGYDSLLKRFDIRPEEHEFDLENSLFGDEGLEDMSPSERMREVNRRIKERREEEESEQSEEADAANENNELSDDSTPAKQDRKVVSEDDSFNKQLFDLLNIDYQHSYYKADLGEDYGEIHLAALDQISLAHPLIEGQDYFDENEEEPEDAESGELKSENQRIDPEYEMVANIADEHGTRLLQFDSGKGTLTAISSAALWDNDHIGLADHALFLAFFVPENSKLHLFYNFDVPSILEIVSKYFYELLIISLLMLCLWLWRRGIRVQRKVEFIEGQRRNFHEHLHAAAKFMTVNNQFQPLLSALQDDISNQMRSFYPGFAQLTKPAQVAMLVERTELSEDLVQSWADYCDNLENQEQLLAALKIGNAIRNKL